MGVPDDEAGTSMFEGVGCVPHGLFLSVSGGLAVN